MEKPSYRENYELLLKLYPGRTALSVKEAAESMNVCIKTVYAAIKLRSNPLPSNTVAGKIIIPLASFARWLA